jgi:serine/threonine protein kinase
LIEDPVHGIMRIPENRTIETAVPANDPVFIEFILKCLEFDPTKRFPAKEAINHPFIT